MKWVMQMPEEYQSRYDRREGGSRVRPLLLSRESYFQLLLCVLLHDAWSGRASAPLCGVSECQLLLC